MPSVTDFKVFFYGTKKEIAADAFGNNIAFKCKCGHPVLAIVRERHRGSHEGNPAKCRKCKEKYIWANLNKKAKEIRIRSLGKEK